MPTTTVTILDGQSLSSEADLVSSGAKISSVPMALIIPAGFDGSLLSFQAGAVSGALSDLYDQAGEVQYPAGESRFIALDPGIFYPIRCLKVRSGSSASPTNQTGDVSITIVYGQVV